MPVENIDINCFSLQTCQSNQWSHINFQIWKYFCYQQLQDTRAVLISTKGHHSSQPQQWDASEWLSISKIQSWLTEDSPDTLLYSSMLGYFTSVTHRWAGLYTVPTKKWPFLSKSVVVLEKLLSCLVPPNQPARHIDVTLMSKNMMVVEKFLMYRIIITALFCSLRRPVNSFTGNSF